MAGNQTKELWRSRIERLLATDMSVAEWCAANKVSESATYVWLGRFDVAELACSGAGAGPAPRHTDPITVSIGPATVSVPANSALADVACVLQAVSAL